MGEDIRTVPNYLTLLRIAIMPFFALAIFYNEDLWALVVLVLAGVTDFLDGFIARSQKSESKFGKLMDPVADKLVICVAFVFLAANPYYGLNPWLACLLLSREFMITAIRALVAAQGIIMGSQWLGKLKTTFQFSGLALIFADYFSPEWINLHHIGLLSLWVSVVLSYWSLFLYSKKAFVLLFNESKS
ncbi:CDP-diacylglycerol--glycerol-3-phosphate 3-phosphatidyltransferase [bacterium]|nr:CDP-diacylglycerol--glycerol-3-phosphate 3-phosphatidyltransferase [bacterium]